MRLDLFSTLLVLIENILVKYKIDADYLYMRIDRSID